MHSINQNPGHVPITDDGLCYDFSKVSTIEILAEFKQLIVQQSEKLIALRNQPENERDAMPICDLAPAIGMTIRLTHEHLMNVAHDQTVTVDEVWNKASRTLSLAEHELRSLRDSDSGSDVLGHLFDAMSLLRSCHLEFELGNIKEAATNLNPVTRSISYALDFYELWRHNK